MTEAGGAGRGDAAEALERFVRAQAGGVHERALAELRAGAKRSHWMWFVLPQLRGLGRSETARFYGLADAAEARAYLAHPVLGPRLVEAVRALLGQPSSDAHAVLGSPDDLKLRSCLTLFERVAPDDEARAPFAAALERFFAGERDPATRRLLDGG